MLRNRFNGESFEDTMARIEDILLEERKQTEKELIKKATEDKEKKVAEEN